MTILFQVRRDSASAWNVNNTTLLSGEFGWDNTNKRLKVGDGSTAWNSLEYSTYTVADLNTVLNSASSNFVQKTILTTTSTSAVYRPVLLDSGRIIEMNNSASNVVLIPINASVAFPIGTQIDILQIGIGTTTVSVDAGVTLNSESSKKNINAQWSSATLIKRDTNTWLLLGALKA